MGRMTRKLLLVPEKEMSRLLEEKSVPIVDYLQQLLRQKEEELKAAQASLIADEDVVHQWEGRWVMILLATESKSNRLQFFPSSLQSELQNSKRK
jgi:hypothetical protein